MKYIAVTLVLLFSSIFSIHAQENIEEGKTIFKSRCASCHAIDKRVIGPALKDVDKRHEEKWIIDFVHSSQTVINGGDEKAAKLFQEYNQTIMPDHKDLSEAQVKNIIAYIKDESVKEPVKASKGYVPEYTQPYKDKKGIIDKIVYLNFEEALTPLKFSDITSWAIIATIIVMLITLFYLVTYLHHILDIFKSNKKTTANVIDEESNTIILNEEIKEEHT